MMRSKIPLAVMLILFLTPYHNTILTGKSTTLKREAVTAGIDQLKQSDWYTAAMKNMAQKEYEFSWQEGSKAWSTPNRRNNLRFFYTENGFTVEPRTTKKQWQAAFILDKKQVGKGAWQINGNKAEYITDKVTVQYINNQEGMRQNFIVQEPLGNTDVLKINFSIQTTLKQQLQHDRVLLTDKNKVTVLQYDQLKVWDANDQPLEASFERSDNGYCIQVDAANASYPITIDPISTTPAAMVESNQANANMGSAVASAGDVNGDGYSDVIVGANSYDNGQSNEGVVFVYHGSATGISTTAAVMIESNQEDALMGFSVAGAGDVNGDGYSDIIAGAYNYDNGQNNEGVAFVYHGSATGINTTAVAIVEGNQANANMGYSVAGAGDVNGDGYSDVIAGARAYDNGHTSEGAIFVYHGSPTGINTTVAATAESNQSDAQFGNFVAGAGDINGDGYSDVIAAAYLYDNGQLNEGAVFIYHGSATGISTTAAAMLETNQASAQFGNSVACAGDVNGDGYSDIIVGASFYDNGESDEGAAFIYHGSVAGINTTAATMVESNQALANFGYSIACAGDVNGDGYSDVIAGAYQYDNGETDEGAIFVYHGSVAGINTTAAAMVESNQATARMGLSVASAGDVNGDGYSDVIAGAYLYDNGETNEGAAFVYHGSATGTSITAAALLENNQADAQMGYSVSSAGDVNGDGYSDVMAGAPFYDNGQFDEGVVFIYHGSPGGISTTAAAMVQSDRNLSKMGESVACAGDINSDGYSDIVAGAQGYTNGQLDEGAAFVYLGSSTGINTTFSARLESNQSTGNMGISVAGAGDVNGDGFGDIIVGAWGYSNGQSDEGAVFVFHGSETGIVTAFAARLESNQDNAYLGYSVAYAGDVNGDGYSDIIAGAFNYDNGETEEGAAFIYHGSASGINTTAAVMLQSNQATALLGHSVAGAGDVNGDGYSDVMVGAYLYDNGQTDEGAAWVYHGSPTGISATAAVLLECNQANAAMGQSVAGAGDVNGDGYSDVIAGAHFYSNGQGNEGVAFVYYGNSAGISNRNNLNVYNTDLLTPVNSSNFSLPEFGAGLFAKSFLGRDKGRLVWEVRYSYDAWSGVPITNSVLQSGEQTAYTDLGLAGTELTNLVGKLPGEKVYTRIRARVRYNPATAITGQLYGPWRYVAVQISGIPPGVLLPVELISFKASWLQKGRTAQIRFITEEESQVCCYEIEKSADGVNFHTIGRVEAKNTAGRNTYTFTDDDAAAAKQYYRLKTIHNSGAINYSNIQLLQHKEAIEVLVFPNPTGDALQLRLNKVYDQLNVQIINQAGQLVKQYTRLSGAGQLIKIPVRELAAGTYFLHLQSGTEKQLLQFVKK